MVTLGVALGIVMGVASGCVMSPGRRHYTEHRTHRLEPSPNRQDEVSIAFGFDRASPARPAAPTTAVATVTDR
ncbi:MAG: hypothetical protein HRU76_15805 [Phycisphaeraceae bacterium]|nr:hypothetical protein [Phycisphaerales bacterium]QOJ18962.1 MAG: hypothetical protein HRU76_15805 [Phycisphaeraceae bacterium]